MSDSSELAGLRRRFLTPRQRVGGDAVFFVVSQIVAVLLFRDMRRGRRSSVGQSISPFNTCNKANGWSSDSP
jgi:hypothetical protein